MVFLPVSYQIYRCRPYARNARAHQARDRSPGRSVKFNCGGEYSDSDSVHSSDTEGDVEEQVSDNEEVPQLMHDEALAIFRRWPRPGVD